ncbi:MAG: hypothetical protein ACO3FQ_01370 [Terrimicrobiaceae bacterium]
MDWKSGTGSMAFEKSAINEAPTVAEAGQVRHPQDAKGEVSPLSVQQHFEAAE